MRKSRAIGAVKLEYDSAERETADAIAAACERGINLARDNWGLDPPLDCHVQVMTSWWEFVFRSAPWPWRILLGATVPFWCFRARRTWPYSAAWTQRYGSRVAIGVKPPRLLASADRSIGLRIFVMDLDPSSTVQHVTCHELVHACSARLRLPTWLNEGIATLTVDRFLGRPTIREETLDLLRDYSPKAAPPTYRALSRMDARAIAYHTVRGYWLVRYLEEKHPGLITRVLSARRNHAAITREIAFELGLPVERFWHQVDGMAVGHFGGRRCTAPSLADRAGGEADQG